MDEYEILLRDDFFQTLLPLKQSKRPREILQQSDYFNLRDLNYLFSKRKRKMGCLPSRSMAVNPAGSSSNLNKRNDHKTGSNKSRHNHNGLAHQEYDISKNEQVDIGTSLDKDVDVKQMDGDNSMNDGPEDDIMSILMGDQEKKPGGEPGSSRAKKSAESIIREHALGDTFDERDSDSPGDGLERENDDRQGDDDAQDDNGQTISNQPVDSHENSFDDELNVELLKQYIVIDYEITQLEDKDALRIYHEKIEQLEQLERELDMISPEAEEVATRSEIDVTQIERFNSSRGGGGGGSGGSMNRQNDSKADLESNSIMSGMTAGSISPKSSILIGRQSHQQQQQQQAAKNSRSQDNSLRQANSMVSAKNRSNRNQTMDSVHSANRISSSAYSTVEEVFNRKIILEKERDKLKKEVELVIVECDKLQQKYKKRDDILDKLFDGKTGNGLENHLEQQLNWLMEQKHYVDQVFYAWKRAETLTSQTCEQFASASELLKRIPKLDDEEQRNELCKSIAQLLIKSRQDMEQAQRYNPNVDAPFFTDTETERFHKIIETVSQPHSISQSEYSQIATVIQFAYKRAVSIRLWLEQILQITIARDSFELAEEYKWIAIQLRKERITLINSKLQEQPYRSMAQTIREQLARQQQQTENSAKGARTINGGIGNKSEINRDSGVESDDIDIEEEIYRLLEMNKSRLEAAIAMQQTNLTAKDTSIGLTSGVASAQSADSYSQQQHYEMMSERVRRRVRGEQPLALNSRRMPVDLAYEQNSNGSATQSAATTSASISTPSKLRVELDEATRQNLLKQVDQIHAKHRSKLASLRGNNKAKANDFISNRMQQARNPRSITEN